MKKIILIFMLCISFRAFGGVTILEPLDFGKLVIGSNNRVSSITLIPGNTSTSTNDIYILKQGHTAELLLEGYPARKQINISNFISNQPVTNLYGGEDFILERLIHPSSVNTDSYGSVLLNIGGQLNTTGSGGVYLDGNYDATIEITIDF